MISSHQHFSSRIPFSVTLINSLTHSIQRRFILTKNFIDHSTYRLNVINSNCRRTTTENSFSHCCESRNTFRENRELKNKLNLKFSEYPTSLLNVQFKRSLASACRYSSSRNKNSSRNENSSSLNLKSSNVPLGTLYGSWDNLAHLALLNHRKRIPHPLAINYNKSHHSLTEAAGAAQHRQFSSQPKVCSNSSHHDDCKENGKLKVPQKTLKKKLLKLNRKFLVTPISDLLKWSFTQLKSISVGVLNSTKELIYHPSIVFTWYDGLKLSVIHGWQWTKKGFKLFGANFKISLLLLQKKIKGQPLTYREHKLLVRTTADLVKLIPFSFFVVVPFAELLLPVALWLFPGMLPSTFSDKQVDNSQLKRKLKAKQELAQFFQEMVAERTQQVLGKISVKHLFS